MRATTLIFITLGMIIPAGVFAGNLNPSAAPASTMVTLDDLQDRTPISSLPYTISSSGSYVLTANLTLAATDTSGITISAPDVTLDLNGYSLTGPGPAAGTSGVGIATTVFLYNIAVSNGTVRDFRGRGVHLSGANHQVWRIRAYNNGGNGIDIGTNGTISDNAVRDNGGDGIYTGYGTVIRNNSVRGNGGDGITAGRSVVIGNACYANTRDGIRAVNSLVAENACLDNTAANLNLTTCTSANNHAP